MIDPQSRSLEWIEQASNLIPNIADNALVEKAIRALSLLESLVRSGCPFIFKGGTALMLHLGTSRRLSIDVDIVCPPGTDIREYLGQYGNEYGFTEIKEIERNSRTGVPKSQPNTAMLLHALLAGPWIRSCLMYCMRISTTEKWFRFQLKAHF